MGETHQEGSVTPGRRPGPSVPGSAVLTPPLGLPAVTPAAPPTPAVPSVPSQRTSPDGSTGTAPVTPAPPAPAPTSVCTCGHPVEMHEHYRAGDDCGACGAQVCGSFTDRDRPRGLFRRLRG